MAAHRPPLQPWAGACPSGEGLAADAPQGLEGRNAEVEKAEGCCVQNAVPDPHFPAEGSFCALRWADAQARAARGQALGGPQMMLPLDLPLSPAQQYVDFYQSNTA